MPPQALAALATLVSFAPHGNRIDLKLDRGAAEMVWATPSTFRFRRSLDGALPQAKTAQHAAVELEIDDQPGLVLVRSKFLEVAIRKNGVTLQVRRRDGSPLMADAAEPRTDAVGVSWERQSPAGARFYGLGPRADAALDLGGRAQRTSRAVPAVHRRLRRRPHGARLLPIRFHEPGALPHRSPRRRLLLLLRPDSETDFRGAPRSARRGRSVDRLHGAVRLVGRPARNAAAPGSWRHDRHARANCRPAARTPALLRSCCGGRGS